MNMAVWKIMMKKTNYGQFFVEAETREEAEEKAWKMYDDEIDEEENWCIGYDFQLLKPRKAKKEDLE